MKPTDILFPAIVQALLTVFVLAILGRARATSMRQDKLKLDDDDVRLGRVTWSEAATKISNNYKSQFELPVLFFAVVAFAMLAHAVDYLMLVLAWVFVLSRVVHSIIHIGPNVVPMRFLAFVVGLVALIAMWTRLALQLV